MIWRLFLRLAVIHRKTASVPVLSEQTRRTISTLDPTFGGLQNSYVIFCGTSKIKQSFITIFLIYKYRRDRFLCGTNCLWGINQTSTTQYAPRTAQNFIGINTILGLSNNLSRAPLHHLPTLICEYWNKVNYCYVMRNYKEKEHLIYIHKRIQAY